MLFEKQKLFVVMMNNNNETPLNFSEVPLPFSVSGQVHCNTSGSNETDVLFTTTREQSTIVIECKDVTTDSPGPVKPVPTTPGGSEKVHMHG